MRGGIPTRIRPRDGPRGLVVGVSGAVRESAGYRSEYWAATDCPTTVHQAVRVACSERVQCADAVRSDSRNSPFTKKYCACASFAFVTGIISCLWTIHSLIFLYGMVGVSWKYLLPWLLVTYCWAVNIGDHFFGYTLAANDVSPYVYLQTSRLIVSSAYIHITLELSFHSFY
jgi:hypothetical protein